jgi:hypothetical protein
MKLREAPIGAGRPNRAERWLMICCKKQQKQPVGAEAAYRDPRAGSLAYGLKPLPSA